ncbi:MAG: dTMP kinase [Deltaproteobacteria bacterium]|nr:dTMP kinase [Deltaproteobacteria bacterium]
MFITFEGIEGCGKSTQVRLLADFFKKNSRDFIVTKEPGGTEIGTKIRSILLNSVNAKINPLTEILLYEADRAQHVEEIIRPSLEAGKIVLCDRFFDATVVYQGYARGLGLDLINCLHENLLKGLKPDLTIISDCPVAIGLKRAWERIADAPDNAKEDRFEKEAISFHEKIRQGYLRLASMEPERFQVIDATQEISVIHDAIVRIVTAHEKTPKI